jgi:hypothetical protein
MVLTERLDDVVSQLVSTKHDRVALAFLKTAEIDTGDYFTFGRPLSSAACGEVTERVSTCIL